MAPYRFFQIVGLVLNIIVVGLYAPRVYAKFFSKMPPRYAEAPITSHTDQFIKNTRSDYAYVEAFIPAGRHTVRSHTFYAHKAPGSQYTWIACAFGVVDGPGTIHVTSEGHPIGVLIFVDDKEWESFGDTSAYNLVFKGDFETGDLSDWSYATSNGQVLIRNTESY